MAIEAPYSKYRKNNILILIAICVVGAVYCYRDGFYNEEFKAKHTKNGIPDSTLVFNQKSPPYLMGAAIILAGFFFALKNKKIVADENQLVISSKTKIAYDSIQKINKTNFDTKGFFIITYKKDDTEIDCKLSSRAYDNMGGILEKLVSKIS